MNIFLKFLINTNQKIIFTYPNADEGFNKYLKVIKNNTKKSNIVSYIYYGEVKIPAVVNKNNILGIQFHPEKSHLNGRKIIHNFLDWKP